MRRLPLTFALVLLAFTACKKAPSGPPASYTVRGILKTLPDKPGGPLQILHEEIPTFKNSSGEVVGMASMEMPFGLAPNVKLDGIAAGDPIEFTFETRWGEKPALVVTALSKLPPGTALKVKGHDAPAAPGHDGHNH